jgi:hypothetical protein
MVFADPQPGFGAVGRVQPGQLLEGVSRGASVALLAENAIM